MAQVYSDSSRESESYSLPDVEVFYMSGKDIRSYGKDSVWYNKDDKRLLSPGWYYWSCFPGCMPDSDPNGPFSTERQAIKSAQEYAE